MRKKHLSKLLIHIMMCLLIATLFSACTNRSTETALPSPSVPAQMSTFSPNDTPTAPEDAPVPKAGTASISGALYSFTIHRILPETMFYLTPAKGEDGRSMPHVLIGPENDQGDIRGLTDAFGRFELNNIAPGNYYLLVWAPYNWEPAGELNGELSPTLMELKSGDQEALGVLLVSWP